MSPFLIDEKQQKRLWCRALLSGFKGGWPLARCVGWWTTMATGRKRHDEDDMRLALETLRGFPMGLANIKFEERFFLRRSVPTWMSDSAPKFTAWLVESWGLHGVPDGKLIDAMLTRAPCSKPLSNQTEFHKAKVRARRDRHEMDAALLSRKAFTPVKRSAQWGTVKAVRSK